MALISYLIPVAALVALVWALVRVLLLRRLGAGAEGLRAATDLADQGAKAFLGRDHVFFDLLILLVAVGIGLANRYTASARGLMAVAIVLGAGFAGIAAWAIMRSTLLAGGRAAQAAAKGFGPAHRAVFGGGMVGGMCAVGFALLGVAALYLVGLKWFGPGFEKLQLGLPALVTAASGFAAGAALVALFARAVGAVYGHAAQHGVERTAKAEEQAPADDVRNPASLARLSSGMLAGVGVDLFAAFAAALVAAMVVGSRWILPIHHTNPDYENNLVVLPLILGAVGIVCALLGVFVARAKEEKQATGAAYLGVLLAEVLFLAAAWFVTRKMLLTPIASSWGLIDGSRLFLAVGLGVAVGHVASVVAGMGPKGKAGWGVPVTVAVLVFAAAWIAYDNAGLYGVALSAVGLVATAGIQAASAAYAPIAAVARDVARLGGSGEEAQQRTAALWTAGRKLAGRGRGYAAAAVTMVSLGLLAAVRVRVGLVSFDTGAAGLWAGLAGGVLLVVLVALLVRFAATRAVNAAAAEAQRQLKANGDLAAKKEGAKADPGKAVGAIVSVSIRGLLVPTLLVVLAPLAVGLADPQALLGLVAGAALAGTFAGLPPEGAGGDDPRADAIGPAVVAMVLVLASMAVALAPYLKTFHGL